MTRTARLALALAALAMLTACSSAFAPPAEDPPPMPEPATGAIRMAVVGDSITEGDSQDIDGGVPGPQSWVSYAVGPDIEFVGGWARWGASTAAMADEAGPLDADVLVILAGTNDAAWMPHDEIGDNLVAVADASGVVAVVLASVPPLDAAPESATALNAYLEEFAAEQGWTWVDAAAGLRDGDRFAPGMSYDGIHPTEQGAQVLGEAIAAAVVLAGS